MIKIKERLFGFISNLWNYICTFVLVHFGWRENINEVQTVSEDKEHKNRASNRFRRRKEKLPQLSITQLEKLKALFVQKQWPIIEDEGLSVFERFYKTLLLLNEKEQTFLINLTYRFDHIPLSEYMNHMRDPLRKLRDDSVGETLCFVTCTPKEEVGYVKSSSAVLYQIKGTTMKQHVNLSPKLVIENIQKLPEYKITDKTKIVLVDDFIGTGDTAIGAVDYVHELVPSLTDNSRIIVFSIVALREGLERLDKIGVKTYFAVERQKAISEEMKEADRDAAMAIMQSIESKLKKLKDDYKFGYKGSEALVSMERCPNNSFPIYWLTKNIAPYER